MNHETPEISIILPCLNEAEALGSCIDTIKSVVTAHNLKAEIIVVDNGSTDGSREIAAAKEAILVREKEVGYGAAYLKGFAAARGRYLFLADADGSYDFKDIPRFIDQLRRGYDFVVGNRFKGSIEKGAMSWLHRYVGNPLLSGILRFLFKANVHDAHCGMRALKKDVIPRLNLKTTGMEFASEMVIKAIKSGLRIRELAIDYHKRKGASKLKTLADGWRHLRFMLLHSPMFLFFVPGFLLFIGGIVSSALIYSGSLAFFGIQLRYHPMFPSAMLIIVGYQLMIFSLFAKTYAINHLGDKPVLNKLYKYATIEKAGFAGIVMAFAGIVIYAAIFIKWVGMGFGALQEVKNSILALTLITLGIQTIFSSFMVSILGIKEKQ